MTATGDDIPSLTLRVLQNIQTELVGMRGELRTLNGKVDDLNGKVDVLNGKVEVLTDRFDHFLTFVGRDVQDLKTRVSALEQNARRT